MNLWCQIVELVFGNPGAPKRLRQRGYRLRRRSLLTGHITLRDSDLIDRPYRLTRATIENKGQSLLGDLRDRRNLFAHPQ